MITFEHFYLTEAKYFPSPTVSVYQHPELYAIKYIDGSHHVVQGNMQDFERDPKNIAGFIIKRPTSTQHKVLKNNNVKAALGVYERDIIKDKKTATQSKIYAFHLAKNKLESPGARANNMQDTLFYNQTLAETARLANTVINSFNNEPFTILSPHSTAEFNQTIINRLENNSNANIDKYTFFEAANNIWLNADAIQNNAMLQYSADNKKMVACKIAILFLKNLILGNNRIDNAQNLLNLINVKPRQPLNPRTDKVSRERLASIIAQIMGNRREDFKEAVAKFAKSSAGITSAELTKFAEQQNNSNEKGYFIQYLNPVYFKDLDDKFKLSRNILVIDDNIDSASTYNAVNTVITNKASQQKIVPNINWVVGIIPISTLNRQAARVQPQQAAPTPEQQAKEKIEKFYRNPNAYASLTVSNINKYNLDNVIKQVQAALPSNIKQGTTLSITRISDHSFEIRKS